MIVDHKSIFHVLPTNDLRPHIDSAVCRCKPAVSEDGYLVIHNSWDGREFFEEDAQRLWKDAYQSGAMGR